LEKPLKHLTLVIPKAWENNTPINVPREDGNPLEKALSLMEKL